MRGGIIAALALATAANASDETRLYGSRSWAVDHVVFDDGSASCRLSSTNPAGLAIYADETGASLTVADRAWNAAPRTVEVVVAIDRARFPAHAQVSGPALIVVGLTVEFLRAFAAGRSASLITADGERLTMFPLAGSADALKQLLGCWDLTFGGADPFGLAAGDPF